jgi:MFS family permease
VLAILFTGVFMAALDAAIVAPALPALRAAFGVDNRQVALISVVFTLCSLSSNALMANLSDRYGRRPIYLLNIGIFALGSLSIALAPGFGAVLFGRALQGMSAGGITPTAGAVIGDTFPAEQRGKALGLLGATFGMAFLIGPPLASLMLVALSWQWLFLINIPIALILLVMGARYLPGVTTTHTPPAFDVAGMVAVVGFLTSLTLGITQTLDQTLGMTLWPWFLLLAALFLALLISVERRAERPVIPLTLFTKRQITLAYLLTLGAGFMMGSIIFITSLITAAFAVPDRQAGFWLIPLVLCSTVGSVVSGQLLHRIGSRVTILIGFGTLIIGYGLLGLAPAVVGLVIVATMAIGLGVGIVVGGALRVIVIEEAPAPQRGAAQGLINICTSTGSLLSAAVIGAIADSRTQALAGLQMAYLLVAGIATLLLLLTFGLQKQRQAQASERSANEALAAETPARD